MAADGDDSMMMDVEAMTAMKAACDGNDDMMAIDAKMSDKG